MPERSITFFVPGLFEPGKLFSQLPVKDIPQLPMLEYFLNHATVEQSDSPGTDLELAALFNLMELPVAALTHYLFNTSTTGSDLAWYMCADPVYIQADRDDAVLVAHEELELDIDKAQTIAANVNEFYKDEPWELVVLSAKHWIIKSNSQYDMELTSLKDVLGRHVREYLPQGKDAKYWQQVLNEIQMLLHGMALNHQRELESKLPVNSLWFWGDGSLPKYNENSPGKWQRVFGNDWVSHALSKYTNCPYHDLNNHVSSYVNLNSFQITADLLYLDQGFSVEAQTHQDFQQQIKALLELDLLWIKPAITLLKIGKLDSIRLLTGKGKSFHLRKTNCNKKWWGWWNKNKLFQQFIE